MDLRKLFCGLVLAGLAVLPAGAQVTGTSSATASITVTDGTTTFSAPTGFTLSLTRPGNANPTVDYVSTTTVTGSAFSASPAFVVSDNRSGSNAKGWKIEMAAEPFKNTDAAVTDQIPAANFKYQRTAAALTTTNSANPSGNTPTETSGSLALASTQTVVSAADKQGRGVWTWTPLANSFSVDIPAGTPAGTYNSKVTVTFTQTI